MTSLVRYKLFKFFVNLLGGIDKTIQQGDTVSVEDLQVPLEVVRVYDDSASYLVRTVSTDANMPRREFLVPAYFVKRCHLTVDGKHLAPYPNMTDADLEHYERAWNLPKHLRTFNDSYRPCTGTEGMEA